MSIVDDRLVGYLSLGTTQPDSLAIKRIIDEGLSIQKIKKALLKGNFDARKYLSGWSARTAQEMVTSGKIPAVIINPMPNVQSAPRVPVITVRVTPPPIVIGYLQQRTTDALPTTAPQAIPNVSSPLPPNREGTRQTEPLYERERPTIICNQQTIHHWEEPVQFETGKQPVTEQVGISAKLLALPSRSVVRNLWSYHAKIPTAKVPAQEDSQ